MSARFEYKSIADAVMAVKVVWWAVWIEMVMG
jgi:hypothetical protein